MESKRVKDFMIPLSKYPHVPCWFSLLQVMDVMTKSKIEFLGHTSLPRVVLVFDLDGQLHGMVRRRDILRGLEPPFLTQKSFPYGKKVFDIELDSNLTELSYDKVLKSFKDRAERPVSDVMLPVMETVDYEDHILTVINKMVVNNLSLLPVLKEKTVVGVIRSVEVYNEISRILVSEAL